MDKAPGITLFSEPYSWYLLRTILLLTLSNIFMTFAWYGHLKFKELPLWKAVLISWGIVLLLAAVYVMFKK